MKEIYVRDAPSHAGYYIYRGYAKAWEFLGYKVHKWQNLTVDVMTGNTIMMSDSDLKKCQTPEMVAGLLEFLKLAEKIFLFVSPNTFPPPYSEHPNFVNWISGTPEIVEAINQMDHIFKWTFCDIKKEYWNLWENVTSVPLAFDSISYKEINDHNWDYDVVYCGGWANNGFDTKKTILKKHFEAFKDSGLKCGFFIERNLTHEQECKLLTNAKVCINLHDTYQHELQLDTNERTFKALGLGGILVSDINGQISRIFGKHLMSVSYSSSPQNMVDIVHELAENSDLESLRKENKELILKNHTYIHRCKLPETL
jgi:hypothetical protein